MTREEVIAILKDKYSECKSFYDLSVHPEEDYPGTTKYLQAIGLSISALTPPTQEQLERVWKGCEHCTKQRVPFCYDGANDAVYLLVGNGLASIESDSWEFMCSYCPRCGRPLTPAAWEELRKRLEALKCE